MPLDANPATAHMFIIKPFSAGGLMGLFSTHPPTEQRIQALLQPGPAVVPAFPTVRRTSLLWRDRPRRAGASRAVPLDNSVALEPFEPARSCHRHGG